ncbi:hypothetical protein EVAR_83414_1 [Eumeta japonica]|uniref:Uncharacterized protein n=1 Tax=Eumeta variegata TaxID=151549 RepID=A0A4C1TYG0_EUMVA|nr:hypothetical protein EVAR_83414_1 [Eumeta japonica]
MTHRQNAPQTNRRTLFFYVELRPLQTRRRTLLSYLRHKRHSALRLLKSSYAAQCPDKQTRPPAGARRAPAPVRASQKRGRTCYYDFA